MRFLVFSLKTVFLLLFCLCLFACQRITEPVTPIEKKPWGVYQILWNVAQFEDGLNQQIVLLGDVPDYVLFFRDLEPRRGFPRPIAELCREKGITPVVSFELSPWRSPKTFDGLGRIIRGDYDDYFRRWAKDAKAFNGPVIMRFGFEMNGDWFSWGQQPEKFKQAWRRVHQIFAKEVASNVQWLFSANVVWGDYNEHPLRLPEHYYPGDDVVDWVGLDGYNFGANFDEYHEWQSYDEVFQESLSMMERYPKPMLISEVGSAPGSKKAEWVARLLSEVSSDKRISGVIYYNFFPEKRGEPNWRLDSDEATLSVFQDWLQ